MIRENGVKIMTEEMNEQFEILAERFSQEIFEVIQCCGYDILPSKAIEHVASLMMDSEEQWNPQD